MKHLAFKKLIPSFALGLIVLGCLWVIAQSSDDGNSLTIDTDKFAAVQHIQQVHLNQKEGGKTLDKIGISNVSGDTLGIGKIDPMTDRVVGFSNTTDTEASSIIAGR